MTDIKQPEQPIDLSQVDYRDLLAEMLSRPQTTGWDDEFKVKIVLESMSVPGQELVKKYGIPAQMINQWKREVNSDKELRAMLKEQLRVARNEWREETGEAIRAALDFIRRAAMESDPTDPQSIRAVAGALKMAGEFNLAVEITLARLGIVRESDRPALEAGEKDGYTISPIETVVEANFEDVSPLEE